MMAQKLKNIFAEKGYKFFLDSPTNQQFIVLENKQMEELKKNVRFGFWEKYDDTNTVVRFATVLGYDGYPSMQRALQEMIRSRLTSTQRIQQAGELLDQDDMLGAVLDTDIENLREMEAHADRDAFNDAVERIQKARNTSSIVIQESQKNLMEKCVLQMILE